MKKILILSDVNSAHTQRWVTALADRGLEVGIFTLSLPVNEWYKQVPGVKILFTMKKEEGSFSKGAFSKVEYIKVVPKLKKVIESFKPDVLHAHYATSYGLIGALSKFHPYVISAWGSDVMDFPDKSYFHKKIIQFNFKRADKVLATSNAIREAINGLSDTGVTVIAFGIDSEVFRPMAVESIFPKGSTVIGTIKSLEAIYGIDILIRAFKKVSEKHKDQDLRLLLVGGGSLEKSLKALVAELDLEERTVFTGKVNYESVPAYHNMIDIFVNVSRNESFGVSVLESLASEKAVVASNIGGLKEVVQHKNTGLLVKADNVDSTAEAIETFVINKTMREEMGKKGRASVKENFEFSKNVTDTLELYNQIILKK